ncbi:hypothetical protein ACS0TY_028104 [Phlomoides rotata]
MHACLILVIVSVQEILLLEPHARWLLKSCNSCMDMISNIWSFGITTLELAHGHAPFSKYPPMKVLLMTLQNAPPGLDYKRDRQFSKSLKEMVGAYLVKDPKKRPSSEKLLKHPFFKHAWSADYLSRSILDYLRPINIERS